MINILSIVGLIIFAMIIKSFLKKKNNSNNSRTNIKQCNNTGQQDIDKMNRNQQVMDDLNRQQDEINRQQQEHFMDESMKSVTPWEHGGYDMNQGNSFNNFNNNNMF